MERLPDLEGDILVFDTDEIIENEKSGLMENVFLLIKHNDKVIWKEYAAFEYYGRFLEISEALQRKYGIRFSCLNIKLTGYMVGDSYRASNMLSGISKCNVFW